MIPLKQLLTDYKARQIAIPAFNIDAFEIYDGVEAAVRETSLPCIVQLSANEDKFVTAEKLFMLVKKANLEELPIYLNMDHGRDLERLEFLIRLGFDMVHFDGSVLSFADNLAKSAEFISGAKSINPDVIVEVEFDQINLIESGVSADSYTNPDKAVEFMGNSGADLLAVSIGNLHGVSTDQPEVIDLDLLGKISAALPDHFFTLHGGSGISLEQTKSAISLGIVKVNINTDLRTIFRDTLMSSITSVDTVKAYEYLTPAINAVKDVAIEKLTRFAN